MGFLAVSDFVQAAFGVVAGGLVGTLLTLLVTGVRERTKLRREDAATVQLVIFEIGNAERGARYIKDGEPYTSFPVTAWETGRLRLARFLDPEVWMLVAAAYNSIHGFNWRYQLDQDRAAEGGDGVVGFTLTEPILRDRLCRDIEETANIVLPLLRDQS
jgi:hypothetical protein